MGTEAERQDTRKAMAYDLNRVFESGEKEQYTKAEIKEIIDAYITGSAQK